MTKAPVGGKSTDQREVPSQLPDTLLKTVSERHKTGLPPVHLWTPPFLGDLDIRIAPDGSWFHDGAEIRRFELVKLFSSILKKEDDAYYLVTPVEKYRITVDDAPFVAVDLSVTGQGKDQIVQFTTHVEDTIQADADHPIRVEMDEKTGAPKPYVEVRAGLEARMDRKTFYRMIEQAVHDNHQGESWFGIWSGGTFFPLMSSDELEA